uniref:Uncharacterized protein n=1 Tax=Chenopodium quinoa TaxID=63459 RepID=A0A803MZC1_CHEQI
MKTKGGAGAELFSNKILQEKTRCLDVQNGKFNELVEDKDEESTSEYDGLAEEDQTPSDMGTENISCQKTTQRVVRNPGAKADSRTGGGRWSSEPVTPDALTHAPAAKTEDGAQPDSRTGAATHHTRTKPRRSPVGGMVEQRRSGLVE